ncbi:MAG TPA: hypothetical protein VIG25_16495 [Pyrinomonadaceae bacterium]
MNRSVRSLFAVLLSLLIFSPTVSLACGPFSLGAVFVFTVHPAFPLERFARGELGVVQPSYARSYLVVAYRHLSGVGFNAQEQKMLTELWKDRLDYGWQLGEEEWIKAWVTARQNVPGLSDPPTIEVYRNREKPNEYETFLNCQKDAFDTAIATLNSRITKYGADSAGVKGWVAAQDQVFSNCKEGRQVPAAPTAESDSLQRADREYQIAAANFYATNFDEAVRGFDSIAADNNSPWQVTAPYLASRSLIRKASLATPDSKTEPLREAEQRLIKILANKRLATSHAATSRLLDLVRLRLHPTDRLHELAKKLTTRNNPSLKQDLWDYTVLLDGFLETAEGERAKPSAEIRNEDLTDWIYTIQSSAEDSVNHSTAKWRSTHSPAWLVAALSKANAGNPNSSELLTEALRVSTDSRAFPSARFHAVRLLMESGKRTEARRVLDEVLQRQRTALDQASQNLLLSQRMRLATDLADFLASAPRMPAGLSWDEDGREIPADDSEVSPEAKTSRNKQFFDFDAANVLNKHLPLSLLKEVAKSSALPDHLRRDVAQAAWLRAVILDDLKTADELAPVLKTLVPALSPALDQFVAAQQPAAKKFAAMFIWLKTPGLEPVVDQGIGREGSLTEQDQYRDNWWCGAAFAKTVGTSDDEEKLPSFTATYVDEPPAFLSAAQNTAAEREYSLLDNFGAAPNYLSRQVIQWANSNPTDPRVPEALHLAVNSTRHGCTDKDTGRWSKAAFDLLHRRYGNTTWAKKTKYWFKD